MEAGSLASIYTKLYIDILKRLALDDPSMEDVSTDISLGSLLNGASCPQLFRRGDLIAYGTPTHRHLDSSVSKKLLDEVNGTLRTISTLFHGEDEAALATNPTSELPDVITKRIGEISSMQEECAARKAATESLVKQINETQEEYDEAGKTAILEVLPVYNEARSASVELIAATIESSLQRLNLIRGQAQRTFYNHSVKTSSGKTNTVSQAVVRAYASLKDEEKNLKAEAEALDNQLLEYETLLQLVDSGSGGYKQIVEDWAKTKRETDECWKDLRRLGWTGD